MKDREEFKIELQENLALEESVIENNIFDIEQDILEYDDEEDNHIEDNIDIPAKKNQQGNDDGFLGVILFQSIIAVSISIVYVLSNTFFPIKASEFIYQTKDLVANDFSFSQEVYDTVSEVMSYLNETQDINKADESSEIEPDNQEKTLDIEAIDGQEENIDILDKKDIDETEEKTEDNISTLDKTNGSGGEVNILEDFEVPNHVTFIPIEYNGKATFPIKGYNEFTSNFGPRINPISNQPDFHTGIDLAADKNTNILAISSGIVKKSGVSNQLGRHIIIQHDDGFESIYGHCEKLLVKEGDKVKQGQVIAKVGSTGYSTGDHLHFAVRKDGLYFNPIQIFGDKIK